MLHVHVFWTLVKQIFKIIFEAPRLEGDEALTLNEFNVSLKYILKLQHRSILKSKE